VITICDGDTITEIDEMPDTSSGFIWFNGEQREIREIHTTSHGTQIELEDNT
jgi:hypothetical protein